MSKTQFPSLKDQFIAATRTTVTRDGATHALVDSIIADIERLLSARPCVVSWPSHLTELSTSLVNYGMPDFAGRDLSTQQDREQLGHDIEATICRFEPRLRDVTVRLLPDGGPTDSVVRFQISARLGIAPDFIIFDAKTELSTERVLQITRA